MRVCSNAIRFQSQNKYPIKYLLADCDGMLNAFCVHNFWIVPQKHIKSNDDTVFCILFLTAVHNTWHPSRHTKFSAYTHSNTSVTQAFVIRISYYYIKSKWWILCDEYFPWKLTHFQTTWKFHITHKKIRKHFGSTHFRTFSSKLDWQLFAKAKMCFTISDVRYIWFENYTPLHINRKYCTWINHLYNLPKHLNCRHTHQKFRETIWHLISWENASQHHGEKTRLLMFWNSWIKFNVRLWLTVSCFHFHHYQWNLICLFVCVSKSRAQNVSSAAYCIAQLIFI